jgi:small multidrug resistance family-3 protein
MIARSVLLFLVAGLMEIGGGYLMWLWLREKSAWWVGAPGAFVLMTYGIIPTLQPANFGRVYAAYGGVFVVMSMFWGWWIDGQRPDRWDLLGGLLCIAGVIMIMYVPRGSASPA